MLNMVDLQIKYIMNISILKCTLLLLIVVCSTGCSKTSKQVIFDFSYCENNCEHIYDILKNSRYVEDIIPNLHLALINVNVKDFDRIKLSNFIKIEFNIVKSAQKKVLFTNEKIKLSPQLIKKASRMIVPSKANYFGDEGVWGGQFIGATILNSSSINFIKNSFPIVAVLDNGIDLSHPYLSKQILYNTNDFLGDMNDDKAPGIKDKDDDNDGEKDFDDHDVIALIQRLKSRYNLSSKAAKLLASQDDDENGYIDDFIGWDFEDSDNTPYPNSRDPHGMQVLGVISSLAPYRAIGISKLAKQVPLRLASYNDDSTFSIWRFLSIVSYSADRGAKIINFSGEFSFEEKTKDIQKSQLFFCNKLIGFLDEKSIVLVAAAPNTSPLDNLNELFKIPELRLFPAACHHILGVKENLMIVTGHNRPVRNNNSIFDIEQSNNVFSEEIIQIAAPAEYIGTLGNSIFGDVFRFFSQTSAATPFVSGGIALLMSTEKFINCNAIETSKIIIKNATKMKKFKNFWLNGNVLNLTNAYNNFNEEDCQK